MFRNVYILRVGGPGQTRRCAFEIHGGVSQPPKS